MARSLLPNPANDLVTDGGAVLWSIVRGEQLEFPLQLEFITNSSNGFTYEAVVVEANNVADQEEQPVYVQPAGVQTLLNVRVPVFKGDWSTNNLYDRNDVVEVDGIGYRLTEGVQYTSLLPPGEDPKWVEHEVNTIYLQFPKTLGAGYAVQPTAASSVYGFFELRVTEPAGGSFTSTWKPVRGMVEILFSPTEIVPDV